MILGGLSRVDGGIRGGQVWGSSDKHGAFPRSQRVDPVDLHATIYHALGLDPDTIIHDGLGRPLAIRSGSAIRGLF